MAARLERRREKFAEETEDYNCLGGRHFVQSRLLVNNSSLSMVVICCRGFGSPEAVCR